MSIWKRAGVVLGAVGAVGALAGAGLAAQRVAARRLRARSVPDAGVVTAADVDATWRLPSHDGGELYVVERGTGPVIVLSHGVTLSVRTWSKQLRSLADAGFRVVAFDHRGHGESVLGDAGHSVVNLGADIRTVLEGLDLNDVVIVGHSMGGIATQSFCLECPAIARERVAGIVLLSTLARSPLAANPRLAAATVWAVDHLPDGAGALRSRDLGLMLARIGFGRDPVASHVEATREMILATTPETRRDAVAALAGMDLLRRLGEIDMPTLVIGGNADLITPIMESRRIARRIPGAHLETVDGGGHMLMFERPELLDRLVIDFTHRVQHGSGAAAATGRGPGHAG